MAAIHTQKRRHFLPPCHLWLTYRMFTLKKPIYLPWRQLYWQFGTTEKTDKRTILNFRVQFLRELAKLKDAWPQLDYRTPPGHLQAVPHPPRIAPARRTEDD